MFEWVRPFSYWLECFVMLLQGFCPVCFAIVFCFFWWSLVCVVFLWNESFSLKKKKKKTWMGNPLHSQFHLIKITLSWCHCLKVHWLYKCIYFVYSKVDDITKINLYEIGMSAKLWVGMCERVWIDHTLVLLQYRCLCIRVLQAGNRLFEFQWIRKAS